MSEIRDAEKTVREYVPTPADRRFAASDGVKELRSLVAVAGLAADLAAGWTDRHPDGCDCDFCDGNNDAPAIGRAAGSLAWLFHQQAEFVHGFLPGGGSDPANLAPVAGWVGHPVSAPLAVVGGDAAAALAELMDDATPDEVMAELVPLLTAVRVARLRRVKAGAAGPGVLEELAAAVRATIGAMDADTVIRVYGRVRR